MVHYCSGTGPRDGYYQRSIWRNWIHMYQNPFVSIDIADLQIWFARVSIASVARGDSSQCSHKMCESSRGIRTGRFENQQLEKYILCLSSLQSVHVLSLAFIFRRASPPHNATKLRLPQHTFVFIRLCALLLRVLGSIPPVSSPGRTSRACSISTLPRDQDSSRTLTPVASDATEKLLIDG